MIAILFDNATIIAYLLFGIAAFVAAGFAIRCGAEAVTDDKPDDDVEWLKGG